MSETIWVAIISALAASLPTIFGIYLNNKHQLEVKRFELDELSKKDAVLNYLEALSDCHIKNGVITYSKQYQKAVNVLLYYFPDLNIELLDEAIVSTLNSSQEDKLKHLLPLIKQLSKSRKNK